MLLFNELIKFVELVMRNMFFISMLDFPFLEKRNANSYFLTLPRRITLFHVENTHLLGILLHH